MGLYLLQTDCPCFCGNYEECGRNECIEISNQIDKRDDKIKDPVFNDQRFEYIPQTQRWKFKKKIFFKNIYNTII